MDKLNFKYNVLGNHPIFKYMKVRCVTLGDAINLKDGLKKAGYEVEIKEIEKTKTSD